MRLRCVHKRKIASGNLLDGGHSTAAASERSHTKCLVLLGSSSARTKGAGVRKPQTDVEIHAAPIARPGSYTKVPVAPGDVYEPLQGRITSAEPDAQHVRCLVFLQRVFSCKAPQIGS